MRRHEKVLWCLAEDLGLMNMSIHTDTASAHEKAIIMLRFRPWWRKWLGICVYMEFRHNINPLASTTFDQEMQKALVLKRNKTNCSLVFIRGQLRIRTYHLGSFLATFDGKVNSKTSCIGNWRFV